MYSLALTVHSPLDTGENTSRKPSKMQWYHQFTYRDENGVSISSWTCDGFEQQVSCEKSKPAWREVGTTFTRDRTPSSAHLYNSSGRAKVVDTASGVRACEVADAPGGFKSHA